MTRLDDKTAVVLLYEPRDLTIAGRDRDARSAGGGNTVELARHDHAFDRGLERNPMDVGDAERVPEVDPILVRHEPERSIETTRLDDTLKLNHPVPATDEDKYDAKVRNYRAICGVCLKTGIGNCFRRSLREWRAQMVFERTLTILEHHVR